MDAKMMQRRLEYDGRPIRSRARKTFGGKNKSSDDVLHEELCDQYRNRFLWRERVDDT